MPDGKPHEGRRSAVVGGGEDEAACGKSKSDVRCSPCEGPKRRQEPKRRLAAALARTSGRVGRSARSDGGGRRNRRRADYVQSGCRLRSGAWCASELGEKAAELGEKAVLLGSPHALRGVGMQHLFGQGIPQNKAKGIEYLERAVQLGDNDSAITLGTCYASGDGVEQDYAKALECYEKAAEIEDSISTPTERGIVNRPDGSCGRAEYNIGVIHDDALGVPHNKTLAIAWWVKAAAKGNREANYELGKELLLSGTIDGTVGQVYSGTETETKCIRYLEAAAAKGHHQALSIIHRMIGDARVEVTGLQKRPELNGATGRVKCFRTAKGRYDVEMEEGGDGTISLKPENFKPLARPSK